MKIIRIDKNNQINGAGLRCIIWISGCENHCEHCHNKETWDYNLGHKLNYDDMKLLSQQMLSPEISGITLTGGDPMSPKNRQDVAFFCANFKEMYPNKTIWCYTGHLFEEVKDYIDDIDVLIDGKFIKEFYSPKLKWRGSSNQRVIDVQKSLQQNEIVEYTDFNGKTITENERGN